MTRRRRTWTHGEHRRYRPVAEHRLYGALLLGVALGAAVVAMLWTIVEARG